MHLHDYTGIIHFHSNYSFDGRTPLEKILVAARKKDVDFLLLTDHSTLQAREDGFEGWHHGILLIVGEEIAPRFNHYLAFGHHEPIACAEREPALDPQEYIDRVRTRGGFGFIAHPDHAGTEMFHVKHYPWIDWSVTGYTGLSIWDFMTDWQNSLTGRFRALLSYMWPALFLRGPSPATLERWDRLTQRRPVTGIGELDNHNSRIRIWGIPFSVFPFSRVMRLVRTHILTSDPISANNANSIALVLEALQKGRTYISLDYFRPAKGFSLTLTAQDREATMGDRFICRDNAEMKASLPYAARVRTIRNGHTIHEYTGKDLRMTLRDPGVYRVEAALKVAGRYRPWIFSNPIYVTRA